jgi:DNA-binding transcriptional LysR family regulator
VFYAGDLLDRDGRQVELTPAGLAALAEAGAAGSPAA